MANRYPLIVDTTDGNKIKEIPSGDNLQLTNNGIIGVTDVTASGTVAAGVLSATSIKKGGTEIATVAVTGSFNDLINRPTQLSDLIDDMNVLVPGDNVGQLTNNVGYLTSVAFGDLTSTPTTLGGYGITDAATSLQGALASTALQPGANISTLFNNAGYLTAADLADGLITVDVNNTGDLVGNVYADDSTLLVDSVLAAFNLDQTIRTNVVPAANGVYNLGATDNKFKDLHISGTVNTEYNFAFGSLSGHSIELGEDGSLYIISTSTDEDVIIKTNASGLGQNNFIFGKDASLSVPGITIFNDNIYGGTGDRLWLGGSAEEGTPQISLPNNADGASQPLTINNSQGGGVQITTAGGNWTFDDAGDLTVPGDIVGYVKIADLKTALQDGAGDYAAFKAWVIANL